MKQKLLNSLRLRVCALVALLLCATGSAWATETVYKTLTFCTGGTSSNKTQDYTSSWTETVSSFGWTISNFNNNQWGWNDGGEPVLYIVKCGRKKGKSANTPSVATIETNAAIDKAITKVVVALTAINSSDYNSIKMYVASDAAFTKDLETITVSPIPTSAGNMTITVPEAKRAANRYYKLEFDTKGTTSSNGHTGIKKVEYYYEAKSDPSLSVSPTALELSYGDTESFTVSQSGDGAVTVTSNDPSVVTVVQDGGNANQYNVSYVGDGNTTITVSVAETATYSSDSKTVTIEALDVRDPAGISFASASQSAVIAAGTTHKQTLTNTHDLAVTYSSSDEDVATVASDGTVTLKTAGTTTITANFAGNASYKPGNASYTLTITDKYVATLVFNDDALEKLTTDAAFINDWDTEPSGLAVLFSSSDNDVATIDTDGEVTIAGAGTTTITATINDASYEATEFTYTLTVNKADAPISFSSASATTAMDETESFVAPTLSNEQGLTITYSSSNTSVATINSSTGAISFVAAGETTITATSTETAIYNSGAVSYTLTVNKAAVNLPFSHTFTSGAGFGDFTTSASGIWTAHDTYGAVAQGSTEGNWLYSPIINLTDETAATLTFSHACNGVTTPLTDKATLWVKEVGGDWEKLTLTYSNNSSWTYIDQEISLNSYCGKKIQLGFKYISSNTTGKWEIKYFSIADDREEAPISFTDATVYKLLSEAGSYTGQALTNEESLTVSYTSSNTDVATVNSSTGVVTIKAVGETDITATYAETADYKANTATYKLVVSAKAAAEIEYAETAATKKITLGTYTHELTNPHELTVAYTSSDETVATVNASTGEVTMLKVGETTITATFTENEDYEGAAVSYTLTVIKDTPTLSFASANESVSLADGTYQQIVSTTPAELPVTYSSSNEDVATVAADGTVTLIKNGVTTITANYAGNDSYSSASTSYTLNVVIDYATLPFAFNSGSSAISGTTGLTQSGLGSDYTSSPKLKFDGTGDYVILKIAEAPGTLTYDILGNSFSGGTFKVQTSTDGETYSDLKSYTDLTNSKLSEEFTSLSEDVRYIKWIYTTKSSGNVALGNIGLTKAPPAIPTFSVAEGEYNEAKSVELSCATDGATIYYTTDSSKPTSSSTTYSSAIAITETTTLKAIAIKSGVESNVATATYTINRPAAPTFDVEEGIFDAAFTLHLSAADGTTIYYSTDGTDPTSSSTVYSDGISIPAEDTTIKAIAVKNGLTSDVATAVYNYDTRPAPTFTLSATALELKVNETSSAVTLSTNSDGAVTFSCANAAVTLAGEGNSRTISANAAGEYTVNVATAATANYLAGAGTITVNVTKKATTMAIATIFDDGKDIYTASEGLIEGSVKYNDVALDPQPTVTYSSSDGTVATVDENGIITFVKAGTTTISASYAGNDEYEECEESYELVLIDSTPQETSIEVTTNYEWLGVSSGGSLSEFPKEIDCSGVTATISGAGTKTRGDDTYIRLYAKNTLQLTAPTGYYVTKVEFDHKAGSNTVTVDGGTWTSSTHTWTGGANSVKFTIGGTSGNNQINGFTVTLAETVTISSARFTTYVAKHNISFPAEVTAYIVTPKDESSVTLTAKASVPKGTAVVLEGDEGTYALPTIETEPEDVTGNKLHASTGSTVGDGETIYSLGNKSNGVGFYRVGKGVTVPAGKAYLIVGEGGSLSVKEFLSFDFEDVPTGLNDVRSKMEDVSGEIFNLAGQKMSRLQKGINIVNGKKIYVK